jgi:hypothetical protein
MSSNSPYQSRFFNFLNRKAIAFNDNVVKTLRSLKVAASWGVQILLYPFYLLVQSGRWLERQIENKFAEIKYQLPSDTKDHESNKTDEVIAHVLEEVQLSLLSDVDTNLDNHIQETVADINCNSLVNLEKKDNLPRTKQIKQVNSIACLLNNKNLVLVTENNEIIDILNEHQQKKLAQFIIYSITQYSLANRYNIKKLRSSLPLITINNYHIISPIRLFWQVMGWMQVSEVARGINLFGESNLGYFSQENKKENLVNFSLQNQKIIKKLDQKIANFEGKLISDNLTKENQIIINQNEYFLHQEDPFQIQVLILAAIDYFFGINKKTRNNHSLNNQLNRNQLTESNSELIENEPYPWLSWQDLSHHQEEETFLTFLTFLNLPNEKSLPQLPKSSNSHNKNNDYNKSIEVKPDWLETDAKHIGYVKNPLEIVLNWLDKCILLLEEMVLFIVKLIKKIFIN